MPDVQLPVVMHDKRIYVPLVNVGLSSAPFEQSGVVKNIRADVEPKKTGKYVTIVSAFTTCMLAAEIHKTDEALRKTALAVAQNCEGEIRDLIMTLVYHPEPIKAAERVYKAALKKQEARNKPAPAPIMRAGMAFGSLWSKKPEAKADANRQKDHRGKRK